MEIHLHIHDGEVKEGRAPRRRSSKKTTTKATPAKKRTRKKDPKMSKAMKEANAKARKANGDYKKGWDRARVMSEAHRLKKKMK